MRTTLLLPVSTAVLATVGLSLAAPPGPGSAPSRTTARVGATTTVAGASGGTGGSVPEGSVPEGSVPGAPRVSGREWARVPSVPGASAAAGWSRSPPSLRSRWAWPLTPRPAVVRPFVRPATPYGAGHRGLDLAASTGQQVLAVETGTVSHVGRVAGRGTVTVLHPSGVRSTYEPVEPTVTVGETVARGAPLGRLESAGSHCRPVCLHLGAVRDRTYLDPLVLLTGGRRVRLLPLAQAPDG